MRSSMCLAAAAALAAFVTGCGPQTGYLAQGLADAGGDVDAVVDGGQTQYTVVLRIFKGPDHQKMAAAYRDRLAEGLNWRGLTVVTAADHSELYWGSFDSIKKAQPTLKRARRHRAANGLAPFADATITLLPGSGAERIGKWDIRNCPGAYSLLVAVFEDRTDIKPAYVGRQEFAVRYCRQLRSEGHEAWYHHGPRSSSVTIGSFGPEAVQKRQRPVVIPGDTRPFYVEHTVPVDPKLLELMKRFPSRAYNGREFFNVQRDRFGKEVSRERAKSMPIRVPGAESQEQPNRANDRSGHRQPW